MHTHTQTQCKKYLFRTARTACSAVVSPCTPPGSSALGSQPPGFIHLPRTDHPFSLEQKTQQGKATEARNPSSPRGPRGLFRPASHQQAQTLAGVGAGPGPPSQLQPGARGKPQCYSGNAVSLTQRKGTEKTRNISLFHLENPCSISVWWLGRVLLAAKGRGGKKMHWWSLCKTPQITLLVLPAFIYFRAAELLAFRFLSP